MVCSLYLNKYELEKANEKEICPVCGDEMEEAEYIMEQSKIDRDKFIVLRKEQSITRLFCIVNEIFDDDSGFMFEKVIGVSMHSPLY